MAVDVMGTVIKCELTRDVDRFGGHRYDAIEGRERYLVRLNIGIQTASGDRFYFDCPPAREVVTCRGGVAIVRFDTSGSSSGWFTETGTRRVATAEQPNDNKLNPRVRVGDVITVRGCVKSVRSTYTVLNRVRLTNRRAETEQPG